MSLSATCMTAFRSSGSAAAGLRVGVSERAKAASI